MNILRYNDFYKNKLNESIKDKMIGKSDDEINNIMNDKLYDLNDMIDAFIAGSNGTFLNRYDVLELLKYESLIKYKK